MADEQFKRNVANKLRISEILIGNPISEGDRFSFLELGDKKVIRVNVIANVVEKYDSEGEKKYSFITLDDGSGQIKVKAFGDDVEKIKPFYQGQTILVIGNLRVFNNELYILPEIVKEQNQKYLIVRKLEIEKERNKKTDILGKDKIIEVKDKILATIKNSEEEGGIEMDNLKNILRDLSPIIIEQEVQKFLEEGIVFEPRPGKIRYLG